MARRKQRWKEQLPLKCYLCTLCKERFVSSKQFPICPNCRGATPYQKQLDNTSGQQ